MSLGMKILRTKHLKVTPRVRQEGGEDYQGSEKENQHQEFDMFRVFHWFRWDQCTGQGGKERTKETENNAVILVFFREAPPPLRMAEPELMLDLAIRIWVFLPIVLITFLIGIIRYYVSVLLSSPKKVKLTNCFNTLWYSYFSSSMMTEMLKVNLTSVVPMVVVGGWINLYFSGFVTTKVMILFILIIT